MYTIIALELPPNTPLGKRVSLNPNTSEGIRLTSGLVPRHLKVMKITWILGNNKMNITQKLLLKAGNVYASTHPITKKNDRDFVFSKNAEDCVQAMKDKQGPRIYAGIMMAIVSPMGYMAMCLEGMEGNVARGFLVLSLLAIYVMIWKVRPNELNLRTMAQRWAPTRRSFEILLKQRPITTYLGEALSMTIKVMLVDERVPEKEQELRSNRIEVQKTLESIAQRIANDKVRFQLASHLDTHPVYDKQKKMVEQICKELSLQINWAMHFAEAKVFHKVKAQ